MKNDSIKINSLSSDLNEIDKEQTKRNKSSKVIKSSNLNFKKTQSSELNKSIKNNKNSGNIRNKTDKSFFKNSQIIKRMEAHDYENKIQELLELLELQESKINIEYDKKLKLLNKLNNISNDNNKFKNEVDNLNNDRLEQAKEIINLSHRLLDTNNKVKHNNEQTKIKIDMLNKDAKQKENDILLLNNKLQDKIDLLKTNTVNSNFANNNLKIMSSNLNNVKNERDKLKERINELENKLDEIYLTRKSESALILEIRQLKDDNFRLLEMLKSSEEYKDFAYLAEDCSGGIRFVKSDSKYAENKYHKNFNSLKEKNQFNFLNSKKCTCKSKDSYLYKSNITKCSNKPCYIKNNCYIKECEKLKYEKDSYRNINNWVPSEAINIAKEISDDYNLNLNELIINELLHKLNCLWKDREIKQINRITSKYQKEVLDLRRKLNNKDPSEIIYLKNEIKSLKSNAINNKLDNIINENKLKKNCNNEGMVIVNSAINAANNFYKNKKELESEIEKLKKIISDKKPKELSNKNFERLKFNEGAFWIISRVLNEIDNLSAKNEELKQDFDKRISGIVFDNELNKMILINSKSWLFNSLINNYKEICEIFNSWKISALKNIDSTK